MKREVMSGVIVTLLLASMLMLVLHIKSAEASETIYIKVNGSVEPDTAPISSVDNITYTLTDDVYNSTIVVQKSNIIVDGNGFSLQGSGSEIGFNLTTVSNVTIQNMNIQNFYRSIELRYSPDCSILDNRLVDNIGCIELVLSHGCSVSGNNASNNIYGIKLYRSSNSVLRNNNMSGNSLYNFGITGATLQEYIQDIDTSNTVDGRKIYYLVNQKDLTVNTSTHSGIGYLGVVNCTNITVENLLLTNNGQGVLLAYTTNSTIRNTTTINNSHGIDIYGSSGCSISCNNANSNTFVGIRVVRSYNCSVFKNNSTGANVGIELSFSFNCSIFDNNLFDNTQWGILLGFSSNNTFSENSITGNNWDGIHIVYSSENTFSGNKIAYNDIGILLSDSSNNTICHNNFIGNTEQVSLDGGCTNTWDEGYPSGGNYWSDLNPPDVYGGPHQNETGRDGIGDVPYIIDGNNTDRYPLIYPYGYVPTIDLNGDGRISITDIVLCALAFGSQPGDPNWNPIVDLNQDGKVTITDIVMIAIHFGEEW